MGRSWFESKDASRKFVDLIYKASTKWANWDPPVPIKVGSYGEVSEKSGAFQAVGNIYDLQSDDGRLLFADPPDVWPMVNEYKICSTDVKWREFNAAPNIGIVDFNFANVGGQLECQFGSKRGAFLVMLKYRIESLPTSVKQAILNSEDVKVKALKGFEVVTKVYTCQAYCLYLSNKSNEKLSIQLSGQVPVPIAPGIVAGGEVGGTWGNTGTEGVFQSGTSETDDFMPLYEIEKIRGPKNRRDDGPHDMGGDRWDIIDLPWGPLDEDGEEEMEVLDDSGDEGYDF